MKHFTKICDGIDVAPLRFQIEANPDIWNAHKNRTDFEGSPFAGTQDAWLRYRAREELATAADYRAPHFSVNYPAWHLLPAAQDIVFDLARRVRAVHVGGVLLTCIPAGGKILPHDDRGSWHAQEMNCKIYVPIRANPECVNYCGGESMMIEVGQAVEFDNLVTHSVENNGLTDRWTLISCFRVDR